jgi:hypothetical protein
MKKKCRVCVGFFEFEDEEGLNVRCCCVLVEFKMGKISYVVVGGGVDYVWYVLFAYSFAISKYAVV